VFGNNNIKIIKSKVKLNQEYYLPKVLEKSVSKKLKL